MVAEKVICEPSFAGLAELASAVAVLLMITGTVAVPFATPPELASLAVNRALPTVLLVNEKTRVPPESAAFSGRVSLINPETTPTESVQLVTRLYCASNAATVTGYPTVEC